MKKVVRKHVGLINAYSPMSALQRKIFNTLLYESAHNANHISNPESTAVECKISFKNFLQSIHFTSNNTQYVKEAIDDLVSMTIEWNVLKDKVPEQISFLNLRVLHGPPTFYKDGTFNFAFHKIMFDLASNPLIYGSVDIDTQSQFESKHSLSAYEILTTLINRNKKNRIVPLDIFRKIFSVNEKYPSVRELTRNVITPSIEEINDRTDFLISIDAIKQGRKIIAFDISAGNKKKIPEEDSSQIDHERKKVVDLIKSYFNYISEPSLNNIFEKYSNSYIIEKIEYTIKLAKKENDGFYPVAYFLSALKCDYKTNSSIIIEEKNNSSVARDEQEQNLKSEIRHWNKMISITEREELKDNYKKLLSKSKFDLAVLYKENSNKNIREKSL